MRACRSSARSRSPATGSPGASARTRRRWPSPMSSISAAVASFPVSRTPTSTSRRGRSLDDRSGSTARRRSRRRSSASPPARAKARGSAGTAGATATGAPVAPTKEALDRVTGDTPAALLAHDYHSLWLNSAGLARRQRRPRGRRAASSSETAAASRRACFARSLLAVQGPVPRAPDDEYVDAMRDGLRSRPPAASRASTTRTAGWAPSGSGSGCASSDALTLRVWQSMPHEHLDRVVEAGILPGSATRTSEWAISRRSWTARSALRRRGCSTARASRSRAANSWRTSRASAAEAGWPVAVHAIGDLANREALDAFERTGSTGARAAPPDRARPVPGAGGLPRYAALGVATSVQFSHAPSDRDLAERFWPDELEGTYAFRSLIESGAVVANGSDAPIEELDPWAGIRAGVLRTLDERPAWRPQQAVTLEQALARDDHGPCLAVGRRTHARPPAARLSRRCRRPRPRPTRLHPGAQRGRGGRDDGRRPLGAQPAALELKA